MRNHSLQKFFALCGLIGAIMIASPRPSQAFLDKTRFATDLGVAFFVFHQWVYKPYRAGGFSAGAPHRTAAMVKGGAALLFALNRVKAANRLAHTSKSPLLQRVAGSLDAMTASFSSVGQRLRGGHFNPADITGLKSTVDSVGSGAAAFLGHPVRDVAVPVPGG